MKNENGFYLSSEALISLLLLMLIIVSVSSTTKEINLDDLYTKQKMHDLLTVWFYKNEIANGNTNDFQNVFPGKKGMLNEKRLDNLDGEIEKEKIISEIFYLNNGSIQKFTLVISN